MIFTAGDKTFTCRAESIREKPIENGSMDVTLGGIPKKQSDGERLEIVSKIRVPLDDVPEMKAALRAIGVEKFYTPRRRLYGKTSIEPIRVVVAKAASIDQHTYNGKHYVYLVVTMEEADPT